VPVTTPRLTRRNWSPDTAGPLTREALSRALADAEWPARPVDLVRHARLNRARPDVAEALAALPKGVYVGPNQVGRAIFGPHGHTYRSP
jgi:hypothetical protein